MWDGAAWPLCCPLWPPWACSPARCPRLCSPPTPEGLAGPRAQMRADLFPPHYAQLGLAFDCVYSGYLAGAAQVALVEQAFRQAPAALKLVDPVMADHGRPYASMTPEIRAAVAQLCGQADVIVPNALYAVSSSISFVIGTNATSSVSIVSPIS